MRQIQVKKRNGRLEPLDVNKINVCVERCIGDIPNISWSEVVLDAEVQLYDKVPTREIDQALILSARSKIEKAPEYSTAAARLLLNSLYKEVYGEGSDSDLFDLQYRKAFVQGLRRLVQANRLNPELLSKFDLRALSAAIKPERDNQFQYLGVQTLYDRYLLHIEGRRMETPQAMFMRVAMGLSLLEDDPTARAIEFYTELSTFRLMCSTPTLFNAGTVHSQLSSCYLSTVEDSIPGIFGSGIMSQALLSKYAGGIGVNWSAIRGPKGYIQGTNGQSDGLIPWLKVSNGQTVSVNQGGKRKGANCAYLENWHTDFPAFLELRKNTGDDRLRAHDLNTAAWISDLFMKRVEADADWWLFNSGMETGDLVDLIGPEFEHRYAEYEVLAEAGKIIGHKLKAKDLWKSHLRMLWETGHPWVTFKDASNLRYALKKIGVIHNSNLCVEIHEHTVATKYDKKGNVVELGETAVCNLLSPNLKAHLTYDKNPNGLDWEQLRNTVRVGMRMLDNVIDLNYYPIAEAEKSNKAHRFVGMGSMGFQDLLHHLGETYSSDEAVELAGKVEEFISYHAYNASADLAEERGSFSTFKHSTWAEGKLPQDTWQDLMEYRTGVRPEVEYRNDLNWDGLREKIMVSGMRNALCRAIAPTATISWIVDCVPSIEPEFNVLFVYSTLSGEFTMVSEWFVDRCRKLGIWSPELLEAIKIVDGDLKRLDLPQDLKNEFCTAFDVDQHYLIQAAAARQVWIDQGQSLNLYANISSLKYLNDLYFDAWRSGLKTTYYLRTQAASRVEKSTAGKTLKAVEEPMAEAVVTDELPACSIEAMRRGEVCEVCQ